MLVSAPADLARHRRVVVHGVTGSGKSVLARRLAQVGGAPYVSVDDLMWRPGWVQLAADEQAEAIRPWAERDAWVMDSLWSATRPLVLPRADLVVALDYRRSVSLTRLLRRTAARLVTRDPICGGNTESWRQTFLSRESILLWHVRSFRSKKETLAQWAGDPDLRVLRLGSPRETRDWLRRLEAAHASA